MENFAFSAVEMAASDTHSPAIAIHSEPTPKYDSPSEKDTQYWKVGMSMDPLGLPMTLGFGAMCEAPKGSRFHTLADGIHLQAPLSRTEMRLRSFLTGIIEKPDWQRKACDGHTPAAWKASFLAAGATRVAGPVAVALTLGDVRGAVAEEADWVLEHVAWLARGCDGLYPAHAMPSPVRGALEARGIIPPGLRDALILGTLALEEGPPDYHPGSNNQVINLVHPSLWPAVYGATPLRGGGVALRPLHLRPATVEHVNALREQLGLAASLPVGPAAHDEAWGGSRASFDAALAAIEVACRIAHDGDANYPALQDFKHRFRPSMDVHVAGAATAASAGPATMADAVQVRITAYDNDGLRNATARGLWSSLYQWLPAEFHVDERGNGSFKSYINNLDPERHKVLYPVLAGILQRIVPLFAHVLANAPVSCCPVIEPLSREAVARLAETEDESIQSCVSDVISSMRAAGQVVDDDDEELYMELYQRCARERSIYDFPQPSVPLWQRERVLPPLSMTSHNLQVIVKIAYIKLTPENPEYPGGTVHVEGTANEQIVASAIYYYDQENIGPSELQFRIGTAEPDYPQYEGPAVAALYGYTDGCSLVQSRGRVKTEAGLCLVWPNTLQHYVAPFSLANKALPGHRKILVFFLVDPDRPILSTMFVPQQQPCVIERALRGTLPPDLVTRVAAFATFSRPQALEHRKFLMSERKFTEKANNMLVLREFSLCEH